MDFKNFTVRDLAIFLWDYLASHGIETVLTGGACVSIYTKNEFLSYDLDFVLLDLKQKQKINKILEEIGFCLEGRHYRHGDTAFIVEFLSPPLSVGEEPVKDVQTIEEHQRKLKLLSPTDCVKDRLAAFYHWNDELSLEQAVLVSRAQTVDLKEIERWSENEGMGGKYLYFFEELKRNNQ